MRLAYAKKFFSQNKKRVEQVASWLCDEESKETYIRIIKFCQTRKERDYITHGPDTQYFINDFFKYGKSEVLIDCGAFDGDTIEKFIAMPNLDYQKIIAFEANRQNFEILQSKFRNNSKIVLINEGVWSKDCELYFSGSYSIGHITESKMDLFEMGVSIKVRSIDSLQIKEKVTFIKADIEGGEIEMLKGARETILRDKPRLAISIYHSNEDMVMIAEYIHALVPEYQLYVRHHQNYPYISETVLYAQIV
jgi:FkbM family methyltransferase